MEVHPDNDQFFRFEKGQGKVVIDGNEYAVEDGSAIVVPAGAEHNVVNTSDSEELKVYTIYSPAHHKDGIIRASKKETAGQILYFFLQDTGLLRELIVYKTMKEEAMANEAEFEGQTTE